MKITRRAAAVRRRDYAVQHWGRTCADWTLECYVKCLDFVWKSFNKDHQIFLALRSGAGYFYFAVMRSGSGFQRSGIQGMVCGHGTGGCCFGFIVRSFKNRENPGIGKIREAIVAIQDQWRYDEQ